MAYTNAVDRTRIRPAVLEPDGWYDSDELHVILEIPPATLKRARRNGSLRFSRRGNRTLYRGAWVVDWLEAGTADAGGAA